MIGTATMLKTRWMLLQNLPSKSVNDHLRRAVLQVNQETMYSLTDADTETLIFNFKASPERVTAMQS